jgi:hypothetical protein
LIVLSIFVTVKQQKLIIKNKLNFMKNLKLLSKNQLKQVKGGITVYIACANGTSGQIRNVNVNTDIATPAEQICGGNEYEVII